MKPDAPISTTTAERIRTGTWRRAQPRFVERIPACQSACPTASDVESWIRLMQRGQRREAFEAATIENPFPAVTGRICPHPCTDACNRSMLGGAVNIRALERAVAELADGSSKVEPFFESTGRRIAIVGSGPSGLACAYHLARLGHGVSIFERAPKAGGMLRYGLPAYRLPRSVLDREIARLAAMGVEIRTGKAIPDATHMQTLRQDYDAVYLSTGARKQRPLGLGEEDAAGVVSGLDFLSRAGDGTNPKAADRVVVIGGGNTAIESARTAVRFGAEVTLVHPGPREGMAAFEEGVEAAAAEGVKFEMHTEPVRILTADGRVSGVACRRLASEGSARTEEAEVRFDADVIIAAAGERIDTSIIPSALHIEDGAVRTDRTGRTEWHNVFAGGDFIEEPRTVAHALAAGKRGAIAIDCTLRGEAAEGVIDEVSVERIGPILMSRFIERRTGSSPIAKSMDSSYRKDRIVRFKDLNSAYFAESEPERTRARDAKERIAAAPFEEIEAPLDEESMAREMARCFHCGRCTLCDNCHVYCPDISIIKRPGGYDIDGDHCKGCGVCAAECPRAAIEMSGEEDQL